MYSCVLFLNGVEYKTELKSNIENRAMNNIKYKIIIRLLEEMNIKQNNFFDFLFPKTLFILAYLMFTFLEK